MMEPMAKKNIEIMIILAKNPNARQKCREKLKRYIDLMEDSKPEYEEYANKFMKLKWR